MAYLRALRLVNFRNYSDESFILSPGLNVIVGDNARGKTNLIEAVSFATTGSTPRTAKENEAVRWGENFCRAEARIALEDGERKVAIGYAPGQKKRLTIDGAPNAIAGEVRRRWRRYPGGQLLPGRYPDRQRRPRRPPRVSGRPAFFPPAFLRPGRRRLRQSRPTPQPAPPPYPGRLLLREDPRNLGPEGRGTGRKGPGRPLGGGGTPRRTIQRFSKGSVWLREGRATLFL